MSQNKAKHRHKYKMKYADERKAPSKVEIKPHWPYFYSEEENDISDCDWMNDLMDAGPTMEECRYGNLLWLLERFRIREASTLLRDWYW